jgi:hypothetical protein
MLQTMYPSNLAERRAQDDVTQWEEDTQNSPYEVREIPTPSGGVATQIFVLVFLTTNKTN